MGGIATLRMSLPILNIGGSFNQCSASGKRFLSSLSSLVDYYEEAPFESGRKHQTTGDQP
jgi:hypothetical protein